MVQYARSEVYVCCCGAGELVQREAVAEVQGVVCYVEIVRVIVEGKG